LVWEWEKPLGEKKKRTGAPSGQRKSNNWCTERKKGGPQDANGWHQLPLHKKMWKMRAKERQNEKFVNGKGETGKAMQGGPKEINQQKQRWDVRGKMMGTARGGSLNT